MTRAEAGRRLDAVLLARLPVVVGTGLSRSAIRRLIMAGVVRAGGRAFRKPGLRLTAGTQLEALIRLDLLTVRVTGTPLTDADILYEDDDLIAIGKPAGLSTHVGADPCRPDAVSLVRQWLERAHQGPGLRGTDRPDEPYLGVHQRLDRETSGVLLFARSRRANPGLSRAFAGREVEKIYHALTTRPADPPRRDWSMTAPLSARGTGATSRMTATPGGLTARTDCRVLECRGHALLVEARPRTGRRHQVRAHLADAGLPILGDTRYGAPAAGPARAPRVMLHCARLELCHPVSGAPLSIECAWPADFRAVYERV